MFRAAVRAPLRVFAITVLVGCATAAAPAAAPAPVSDGDETIVYLVRHAEKSTENPANPDLSTAGFVRADSLASQLREAGINVIIATQWKRTIETAAPLARKRRIEPEIVSTGSSVADHVDSVVAAIKRHQRSKILVVGHSNTIARIAEALGGPRLGDLCDSEYNDLIIMSLHRAKPVGFLVDSYGPPSPPNDGTCIP